MKDVALDRVKNEEFDWIVIEVGANEFSNLDLRKSESENNRSIQDSVALSENLIKKPSCCCSTNDNLTLNAGTLPL